ncbi:hypothetical protein EMCRGX_G001731 [Ephydatia muelleri]
MQADAQINSISILEQNIDIPMSAAEDRKMQKYKHLDSCYSFTPVAIETSGVFGPKTTEFLKELGLRLRQVSGEANSFAYLTQRLSVAIQRGNAASVLGTIKMDSEEEEFLVLKLLYCMSE